MTSQAAQIPGEIGADPTTAEIRALAQIADPGGRLSVIALDHGDPLLRCFSARAVGRSGAQRAISTTRRNHRADASAVLLDQTSPWESAAWCVAPAVGSWSGSRPDGFATVDGLARSQLIDGLARRRTRARRARQVMVFIRTGRGE